MKHLILLLLGIASILTQAFAAEPPRLSERSLVQPGLAGLMDGSVSTLAPLFAAAFATHDNWQTFLVGMAASVGAGISMGFAEALSDDGALTGRGHPWLRGTITGLTRGTTAAHLARAALEDTADGMRHHERAGTMARAVWPLLERSERADDGPGEE